MQTTCRYLTTLWDSAIATLSHVSEDALLNVSNMSPLITLHITTCGATIYITVILHTITPHAPTQSFSPAPPPPPCPHTIIPPPPPPTHTAMHYKVLLSVGVKEEEPKPAKRHKPLFICKKTTSEPTSQACSSNCDTSLSQESMVSPPLPVAALHTSSASSSLLASPLEPPSSQHTMVRWGPMSPAFLIKGQSLSTYCSCQLILPYKAYRLV